MSSRIHESQPSSPVERILICHPTLPEKCVNNLSEDADLEELAEAIFLYEDSSKKHDWKRDAVQFMGLCVALYSLPSSLKKEERTKQVYLGKSTLIFVPLEENGEVLAVVQIRRGGGNPLAVRQSFERSHSLFRMFHEGGIIDRLKQKGNRKMNESNCVYPGLDKLYSLRKEIRKHRTKQSRISSNDNDYIKLQQRIDKLCLELDQLQQQLPNESIRRDLASHYNEYLDNLSLVTSRQGGGLRCLVDCVPAPIAQDSGLHTVQSSPSRLCPEVNSKLQTDMQHILSQESHQPLLFGISTFYLGHLVQSDFFGSCYGSHLFTEMTPDIVTSIMGYMASYRIKLQQNARGHGKVNSSPLRIGKIASSLASNYQDHADQPSLSFASSNDKGSFLVPPPSFMMMSGSDDDQGNQSSIDIEDNQVAWAPKITLPTRSDEESNRNARVLLYSVRDFSFLVFLRIFLRDHELDLQSNAGRDVVSRVLASVRDQLYSAVLTTSSIMDPQNKPGTALRKPGVDFILIHRKQQELILFTDHDSVLGNLSKKPEGNGASPRKLFGFMPARRTATLHHQQEETKSRPPSLEWSVLGLDCRHLLASHLHLDVLLAFDDMMNQIATKKIYERDGSSKYVELCTCMAVGWVYGSADEDTELYAFFDSSTYVTVSDVQNAVKRIKEKISQS